MNKVDDPVLASLYSTHNLRTRGKYFCIYEKERSEYLIRNIRENSDILDLGCRDGALTKYVVKDNRVLGCDIDAASLIRAKKVGLTNTLQINLNGNWKELKSKRYNFILAFEIIEHLYHPQKVMEKITHHLSPGGSLLGSVPNGFSLLNRIKLGMGIKKGTSLEDPTHINHFSYNELKNLLEQYFAEVEILPLTDKKYIWPARLNPGLFSYMFMFKCK